MKTKLQLALALVAAAVTGLAQSSGNIVISGSVPNSTTIEVTEQTGYNNLNITTGETDKTVAIVKEKSNWPKGYTVTLKSANAGSGTQAKLVGAEPTNTDVVNYSMKYNGVGVTLVSGEATVTSTSGRTGSSGVDKSLQITFSANAWIAADTYSDTLTLTIATK